MPPTERVADRRGEPARDAPNACYEFVGRRGRVITRPENDEMGLLEKILGCPVEIHPSSDDFGWRTAGIGTRYLLVTCDGERPVASLYGTAAESRSALVKALDALLRDQKECLLLGIETMDLWSKFFQLDPAEAHRRLAAK